MRADMQQLSEPERPTAEVQQYRSLRLARGEMSARGGCQCKFEGQKLNDLIGRAMACAYSGPAPSNPAARPEDCAFLNPPHDTLLVTVDFNPLLGVNLFDAGRIAACHAMSDVYACGGRPLWALDVLVSDPTHPLEYTQAVLAGIMTACADAGVEVVGGQTIEGSEMMAGLAVIGVPRGERVLKKSGARPGEKLFLSKPLGIGLVVRGYQLGLLGDDDLSEAVELAATSNERASIVALDAGVTAATDVTGFGFLGHLSEMLDEGLGARVVLGTVPVLRAATSLPSGVGDTPFVNGNFNYVKGRHTLVGTTDARLLTALLDPQTNGGLLVSAGEEAAPALARAGFAAVGEVVESDTIEVTA